MIGQFEGRLGGEATITTPEGHVIRTEDGRDWWLDDSDHVPASATIGLLKMANKELYDRLEARDKALDLCQEKNAKLVARINELEFALSVGSV